MQTITTIGLDIAKSVFQVHGVDAVGQVVIRRQLKRRYVLVFSGFWPLGDPVQRPPCGERIHVIPPAHDLAILNRGDRDKPVVIGRIGGEYLAMHFVLEGHDTAVLGRIRDQRIAAIKPDVVTVSRIERHEARTAAR
jgi:hypothetical protein